MSHEREKEKKGGETRTLVGQVHGKRWTDVHARDEPLVPELGDFIEGVEDDVFWEETETRTMHDQEGIAFALLELPLSLDGCVRDAREATGTALVDVETWRRVRTLQVPGERPAA